MRQQGAHRPTSTSVLMYVCAVVGDGGFSYVYGAEKGILGG